MAVKLAQLTHTEPPAAGVFYTFEEFAQKTKVLLASGEDPAVM